MNYGLTENTTQKILAVFNNSPEIEEVIIYGSRAKGNFRAGSDIDLVFKGHNLNSFIIGKIDQELDDLLLPYLFDLSVYDQISNSELLEHINRAGKKFYNKIQNSDDTTNK